MPLFSGKTLVTVMGIMLLMIVFGGSHNRHVPICLLAMYGTIAVLQMLVRRNPEARWVYWLWGWQIGPRTEPGTMDRDELFHAAGMYLLAGVAFTGATLAYAQWLARSREETAMALGIFFALAILALTFLGGGAYMAIRQMAKRRER